MPGIINDAVGQVQKPPEANPVPPVAKPAQKRTVTPDMQRIEIAAKKVLAKPEVAKAVVGMIRGAGDPARGIAQATIFVMKQLGSMAKGAMPTQAVVPAAQQVLVDVAKLGAAAKLYKITPELIKQAAMLAIQMFTQSVQAKKQQAPAQAPAPQPAAQPVAAPPVAPAVAPAGV